MLGLHQSLWSLICLTEWFEKGLAPLNNLYYCAGYDECILRGEDESQNTSQKYYIYETIVFICYPQSMCLVNTDGAQVEINQTQTFAW